ncbi:MULTISPECIES: SMI1/KNR4 family protein [unclassified Breznakia]|uniref:SMI1/KNR4 family protein n=1 Tax=unclassified Breznakia TaxID=2623764 RepID=UPI002475D083|nr:MULTISPECIES: SMI1/KNR4 family protein [unclassified Breznakia]MDH6366916.1 hypothetical protein [Breznakia sp. PH1-1]MDH6404094.1 hypothetical protein [Breznakia sp. PF1-11]MDH6411803.1 hypothetical protein [Breznakia sp. PFB1-11]MDH6414082.1 hypothetical protein [Breznakia sp. PFB1-14]MDH6416561.1 hypothetical protein [Breznakia sp. PFB1-4]
MLDKVREIEMLYMQSQKRYDEMELHPKIMQFYLKEQPVSDIEYHDVLDLMGFTFPADLAEFYHYKNGSGTLEVIVTSKERRYRILSLAAMIELKMYFQNKIEPSKSTSGYDRIEDPTWIAFAASEDGSFLLLDTQNQVILEYQFGTQVCVTKVADSFTQLLTSTIEKLKEIV